VSSIAAEEHGRDMAAAVFIVNQEDYKLFKDKHPGKEPGPHDCRRIVPEKALLRQRLEGVSVAHSLIAITFVCLLFCVIFRSGTSTRIR
jgi:hypothetical protein